MISQLWYVFNWVMLLSRLIWSLYDHLLEIFNQWLWTVIVNFNFQNLRQLWVCIFYSFGVFRITCLLSRLIPVEYCLCSHGICFMTEVLICWCTQRPFDEEKWIHSSTANRLWTLCALIQSTHAFPVRLQNTFTFPPCTIHCD
jgi:hypothetical protein